MDIFKLLSRGARIDKQGKHKKDLEILGGRAEEENQRKNSETQEQALKNEELALNQQMDFFKSSKITSKNSGEGKDKRKRSRQQEQDEQEESDSDIAEKLSLAIYNDEQAANQRKALRVRVSGEDVPLPIGSFEDLTTRFDLPKHLLRNLKRQNFDRPTAIQSESIPIMIHGRDIIACAPTGSGKTLAFGIPLVHTLKQHSSQGIRCVIVSPTKELATQIYNEMVKLSKGRELAVCVLTKSQAAKLKKDSLSKKKYDIVIATPLRLVSCIKEELVDLSHVEHLILDEADKLLEQGFVEQTDDILAACSNVKIRKALFSATMPSSVEELANSIMHSPIRVIVGHKEGASQDVEQKVLYTGSEAGKLIAIRQMVHDGEIVPPVIIFVQSIDRAKALFHELLYDKLNVDVIHGERTQNQRDRVIERFRSGEIWVLICTDVLARGIDFRGVNLVINYDVPQSAQSYVHRIGRTGRAGRKGRAITFFTKDDSDAIKNVVNVMKQSGSDVSEWMTKMKKLAKNEKKQLKKKPIERRKITTTPGVVTKKRRDREDMLRASKKRKEQDVATN